ncbi:SDR family oxidoreductase [Corynebacterium lubricantis]|uniref:SDR family oxidoreductase n=1 Tax=Corynebacterium lubricantis TaxID=541095 RepID=UPI000381E3EC|nr:SDR family oxidoreductase [Corynebacterium lubricantis]
MNSGPILVLGGTSDIGIEIAQRLCAGRDVVLAARRPEALEDNIALLRAAGAKEVRTVAFEATDTDSHRGLITAAQPTTAIVCFGILGDQQRAELDEHHAVEIAAVDYLAQVSVLTVLADEMTSGDIIAFSSIAGWRARRANYVYGSTKAGLDAFCQGLTDRLHGTPVRLITARPGFVIGSMTEGMKPAIMSVTPDVVAKHVVDAMEKKGSRTVWIPRPLQLLAWIMNVVPRPIWRRMPR